MSHVLLILLIGSLSLWEGIIFLEDVRLLSRRLCGGRISNDAFWSEACILTHDIFDFPADGEYPPFRESAELRVRILFKEVGVLLLSEVVVTSAVSSFCFVEVGAGGKALLLASGEREAGNERHGGR